MTGLVFTPQTDPPPATPPAGAAPPTSPADVIIIGDSWYPDVDLSLMRAAMRFDGTVTPTRLGEAALAAIISVGRDLEFWRMRKQAAGATSLAAVDPAEVGGENRLEVLYRRAVSSTVKADLDEAYRDYSATVSGELRADNLTPTIGDHRRNARWAIRDIQSLSRSTVELI